jgi:sporulation protein YlmC with PRC-barrel domain
MENKVSVNKEVWISYIDDSGFEVKGFFMLIEQNLNFIKIKSGSNILTIPYHKVNKIKERV